MLDDLSEHRSKVRTATAVGLDVKVIMLLVGFHVADLAIEVHHMDTCWHQIVLDVVNLSGKLGNGVLVNRA